jgi:hypothetical protein
MSLGIVAAPLFPVRARDIEYSLHAYGETGGYSECALVVLR